MICVHICVSVQVLTVICTFETCDWNLQDMIYVNGFSGWLRAAALLCDLKGSTEKTS